MTSKTVKTAVFRDQTEHLFRLANVDYHACVNAKELANWRAIASRVLADVEQYECKRASAYDQQQFRAAVDAVRNRIIQASNARAALLPEVR